MAQQKSKNSYGRQIFLSREEIRYLRDMASSQIVQLHDQLREAEEALDPAYMTEHTDVKFWNEQKQDIGNDLKLCHKLVGDPDKDGDNGKLWYYLTVEESEARNG